MRFLSTVSLICVLHASQAVAPGLDIGGVELRLGQDISGALKALSSYQIRYSDLGPHWLISQKGMRPFGLLGTPSATDGKVSSSTIGSRIGMTRRGSTLGLQKKPVAAAGAAAKRGSSSTRMI